MVAWHAHNHMAVIPIPPIICLCQTKVLPQQGLNYWIFLPASLFVAMVFVPQTMLAAGIISGDIRPFTYFVIGVGEFSANMFLFCWALQRSREVH